MVSAEYWIKKLALKEHPEGGYYKETYRSDLIIPESALPGEYGGGRNGSTAIFFLVTYDSPSFVHRLLAEELWHFYDGHGLTLHMFREESEYEEIRMGRDLVGGERLQYLVPSGCWFGASVAKPEGYALVGCSTVPGFDFNDFELGERDNLVELFPDYTHVIDRLTKTTK